MLTIARCLESVHEVSILWDKTPSDQIRAKAKSRFGFDLSTVAFKPSFFHSDIGLLKRRKLSREYDLIIYLSDGSIPVLGCPLIIHFQSPMPWVKGATLKNRIKMLRVKDVICNSAFTKSYIDKYFAVSSKVLYPPVSVEQKYVESKKEKVILNVGRFGINHSGSSYKKQDILADAFMRMVKEGLAGWKLVLAMSVMEQDNDKLEEFKKKYADERIVFAINCTNDELWDHYQKASIYWHAAGFGEDVTLHPDRAEHFGISTVEAMGAGAVPIVINAGGQKEIVTDEKDGRLWNSIDELISRTRELIEDEQKRKKLAGEAAVSAQRFLVDHFCQQLTSLIV